MILKYPQCINCSHFDLESIEAMRCRAFPGGIPEDILRNSCDHREPYPGDNGFRYKADDPDDLHPLELNCLEQS
jgi:hypothetical protein